MLEDKVYTNTQCSKDDLEKQINHEYRIQWPCLFITNFVMKLKVLHV